MTNLDNIINEVVQSYLNNNLVSESFFDEAKKKKNKDDDSDKSDKSKDEDKKDDKKSETHKKKKKKFKKNAIKGKGGLRKDFDIEDDEMYNKNVDDQEQSSITDILNNDFINVGAVAQKLYPDHTKEGAQSQLRKKLEGEASDSGSVYKLKSKEVRKLRSIIASFLK